MFGFFESEETKKLKSHIANLGALAKIDGHVDPNEMNFIISIGKKHGMKADDVRHLISNAEKSDPQLPTNDSERFDQIYDLVEMMLADGIVDESEMEFCISMAARLGFKKSIVGVLVRKISMGVKDGFTREHIKREAQTFLNY
ncbi:tellurite resistance TerB family protein [Pontibacter cellulosilyticus]|uniref:TerB family tellurite resistance protein n=1 Tax=Pontibacter cellulosilyticus TaxID=1720253 RepID=A0A923N814_9BACT|nr:TerB family tellurite resistance protein [Pontibacter cellulosilyticus]MBC5992567.1 TerB family tellurite resistance protein [Pontibacter cellulosilyticus]